jgi:twitching motility protein PilT
MPKLDRFLSALSEYKAEALVLEQDSPPAFRFLSGTKPVSKTVLGAEQLLMLIAELASPKVLEAFRQDGATSFTYQLGSTSYTGMLEEDAGRVVATLWETTKDVAAAGSAMTATRGVHPVLEPDESALTPTAPTRAGTPSRPAGPAAGGRTAAPREQGRAGGAAAGGATAAATASPRSAAAPKGHAPTPAGAGGADAGKAATSLRTGERQTPRAADRATDKAADRSAGKADRVFEKASDKTADKAADKAGDRASDKAGNKAADRAFDKASDRTADRKADNAAARSAERPAEPAAGQRLAGAMRAASEPDAALTFQLNAEEHSIPDDMPSHSREEMDRLLRSTVERHASDLHLSCGNSPIYRIDGLMSPEPTATPLAPEGLFKMLFSITPRRNRDQFLLTRDTDFAYAIEGLSRFRVNLFHDRHGPGAVFRAIPNEIASADQLGLPTVVRDLARLHKGLVLVTGPTGSGKSTTLAAMLDVVNQTREDHVITIEDPIEFVHPNKKCLINQREVGIHTGSFKAALRAALREDPDVVLVGEMRDLETVSIAIETAVTGHLVFGTLHTTTAATTVDRLIDQFPHEQQDQVRVMLADSLRAVISQTLVRKKHGGRVAAMEVLLCTPAVSNLIREAKTFQLEGTMQTAKNIGMQTLNDHLLELVKGGQVDPMEAYLHSVDKVNCRDLFARNGIQIGKS